MGRLNLERRPYDKVLWKIKLNVFSFVSIFHQRKNIRTVINIIPTIFVFLAHILDKTHKMLYWFYVIYASSSFVLNRFPFFSDVAFDDSLIFIKFVELIVISLLKTFSFLKAINVASQEIVWQQTHKFTEYINQLDEDEVWVKATNT